MEHMDHKLEGMLKMAKLTDYEASKLRHGAAEIRSLRRELEMARARLLGFDDAMALLNAMPVRQGMGMGEDVAWALDRMAESEPEAPPTGGPVEDPKPDFPGMTGSISGDLHNQDTDAPAAAPPKQEFFANKPRRPWRPDDAL